MYRSGGGRQMLDAGATVGKGLSARPASFAAACPTYICFPLLALRRGCEEAFNKWLQLVEKWEEAREDGKLRGRGLEGFCPDVAPVSKRAEFSHRCEWPHLLLLRAASSGRREEAKQVR